MHEASYVALAMRQLCCLYETVMLSLTYDSYNVTIVEQVVRVIVTMSPLWNR